jgi:hemerythrin
MAVMAWGSHLETGHAEIDSQHKVIVDLLNQVHSAALGSEQLDGDLLLRLKRFVESHFYREEELMKESAFPALNEHKAAHGKLLKDLNNLIRSFQDGTQDSIAVWMEQMHAWFLRQIINEDKPLAEFLREETAVSGVGQR